MKGYIIENGSKIYFNDILVENKRAVYFGCGMQNNNDLNALFIHKKCSLFCAYKENGQRIYNSFDSENGKENHKINFNKVDLK